MHGCCTLHTGVESPLALTQQSKELIFPCCLQGAQMLERCMDAAPCIIEEGHGCCTLHSGVDISLLPQESSIAHDEPTMLERCAGAACFQLESCIKAVLRMMEGSAEGFSALSKGRNQIAISVALSWRRASQRTHRACGHFSSYCLALQQSAGGLCSRLPMYL